MRKALSIGLFSIFFGVNLLFLLYTSVPRREILAFETLYSNLNESCFVFNLSKFLISCSLPPVYIKNISPVKLKYINESLCRNKIFKYVETSKRRILMNSFITSQFSYCPLIWMFHNRRIEHRVNKIHERAFRLIYPSDSKLTFKELLDKKKTVSTHQKNLLVLATEIFKAKLNISPEILRELFSFIVRNYNFRSQLTPKRLKTNSVYFGSESLSSLAAKI